MASIAYNYLSQNCDPSKYGGNIRIKPSDGYMFDNEGGAIKNFESLNKDINIKELASKQEKKRNWIQKKYDTVKDYYENAKENPDYYIATAFGAAAVPVIFHFGRQALNFRNNFVANQRRNLLNNDEDGFFGRNENRHNVRRGNPLAIMDMSPRDDADENNHHRLQLPILFDDFNLLEVNHNDLPDNVDFTNMPPLEPIDELPDNNRRHGHDILNRNFKQQSWDPWLPNSYICEDEQPVMRIAHDPNAQNSMSQIMNMEKYLKEKMTDKDIFISQMNAARKEGDEERVTAMAKIYANNSGLYTSKQNWSLNKDLEKIPPNLKFQNRVDDKNTSPNRGYVNSLLNYFTVKKEENNDFFNNNELPSLRYENEYGHTDNKDNKQDDKQDNNQNNNDQQSDIQTVLDTRVNNFVNMVTSCLFTDGKINGKQLRNYFEKSELLYTQPNRIRYDPEQNKALYEKREYISNFKYILNSINLKQSPENVKYIIYEKLSKYFEDYKFGKEEENMLWNNPYSFRK
ncbi:hypothetical protein WA158_002978 [Blastocystis sp. Blastoise]